MNAFDTTACRCTACIGAACTCGCQSAAPQSLRAQAAACGCGPSCACQAAGPVCRCGTAPAASGAAN